MTKMTPKLLRFQAFASYKNEQIINFEQLGANEIFLIHGKTGSGKTSILDAVTYALYGKSSGGGRGEIEDIRCKNYGARDIPTELEFVFEIKGRIYKFIRRVYERKKRSGCTELVSEHNALFYKEDRFFPFFENPTKTRVNEKAEELIGLTYNQFLQVVILPQGKFESFLVAPSKDKEEILVTLFQIDDWNKIGDWIFRQGAELEGKNVEKKGELSGILSQLECEKPEEIEDKNSGLEALVNQKYESLKAAIKVYESASVELEEMKQVAAYFEKRRNLEKQKDELLKRESEIEKLRIRLKRNEDAKKIAPVYEALTRLSSQLSERKSALENEEKILIGLEAAQEKYKKLLAEVQIE
ncbi:MAG: SMC family ATPase [Oscillospiraceae bacterium]